MSYPSRNKCEVEEGVVLIFQHLAPSRKNEWDDDHYRPFLIDRRWFLSDVEDHSDAKEEFEEGHSGSKDHETYNIVKGSSLG